MPPSRYKVVEKGRRLVVIDRLTGEQVRHQIHQAPHRPDQIIAPRSTEMRSPAPSPSPRPQLAAQGSSFTTQNWYDDKAPRTLSIPAEKVNVLMFVAAVLLAMAIIGFFFFGFFALFVIAFLTFQKGTRTALRRGVTSWLDGLEG